MEETKIVYNEEADYTWHPTDNFTINGKELEIAHNTMSAVFNSNLPMAQMYLMLHEVFKITSSILKRGVEDGLIQEVKP